METAFDLQEVAKLKQVVSKLGDFIAIFEAAEEHLVKKEKILEQKIEKSNQLIKENLGQIYESLHDFEAMMTETGVARFRLAANRLEEVGDRQIQSLESTSQIFLNNAQTTLNQLEKVSHQTVKILSQAVLSFNVEDAQKLVDESCLQIENVAQQAIHRIYSSSKWLQWKNMGLALALTLVTLIASCLYINDEWPWEIHGKVMEERRLAQAVLVVWPQLSGKDQEQIAHNTSIHT